MGLLDFLKKLTREEKYEPEPEEEEEEVEEEESEEQGPLANEYGDIIITMDQFNQLVRQYSTWPMQVGSFKMASAGGNMNYNINVNNNIANVSLNGSRRTYDTNVCKAVFVDGDRVYVVIDSNHLRSQGIVLENNNISDIGGSSVPSGIDEEFDMTRLTCINIKTSSADVSLLERDEPKGQVYSEGAVTASVNGNVLVVDATHSDEPVGVYIPTGVRLDLVISSSSGDISVEDLHFNNVSLTSSSGDINFEGSAVTLNANASSGDLDIIHNYVANGSATLSTSSGDINYSLGNVGTLNLSCSGEVDNYFERTPGGYIANVVVNTSSGDISIN